jgi:7,8-didemethyl-8-hydroxy-5-deazariboflavin synthase CofG subunit
MVYGIDDIGELEFSEACRLILEGDSSLFERAAFERDRHFHRKLTYSPKVFLPVTNLCRDRCSYCTFRKGPKDPGAHTMTLDEIGSQVETGAKLGCHEALLCLGDHPEAVFPSYRKLLGEWGFRGTADYLVRVSERCLDKGLLPHTNAGLLSSEEMLALRATNVSLGLMLENISDRLCEVGGPHQSAPTKRPARRMEMLENAGKLKIPFTTGILVGIGETVEERVETLYAIRELHQKYGHIQEVIIQIFRAKDGTRMAEFPEVTDEELFRTVAVSRLILGSMNVQAPPNLTPQGHRRLIEAGINDWGGVSPVTCDFINPEAPWPHLTELSVVCREAGHQLEPRLPVYPEFLDFDQWIDPALKPFVHAHLGESLATPV